MRKYKAKWQTEPLTTEALACMGEGEELKLRGLPWMYYDRGAWWLTPEASFTPAQLAIVATGRKWRKRKPAPEQPAAYPWHPDVLSGEVSIEGGLVNVIAPDGERYNATVLEHDQGSEIIQVVLDYPGAKPFYTPLYEARPARHEWQAATADKPGDTALVVSTAATPDGWNGGAALPVGSVCVFLGKTSGGASNFRTPAGLQLAMSNPDLLYIPPAEQPDARAEIMDAIDALAYPILHTMAGSEAALVVCKLRIWLRAALDAQVVHHDPRDHMRRFDAGVAAQRAAVLAAVQEVQHD